MVEPNPNYYDNDERRRAKLLSSTVLIIFPIIILVGIVIMPMISAAPSLLECPTFLPATSALVISVQSFVLNRAGYYFYAANLYIAIFFIAPFYAVVGDISLKNISIGTMMVGGVFLTRAFYSNIKHLLLAGAGVVFATMMIPVFAEGTKINDVGALVAANFTISMLIILYSYYRNGLEIHRHAQLHELKIKIQESYDATLEGWARALELIDKETVGHSRRVVVMTMKMANAMGFEAKVLENIRRGALLHDIGKMGIPESVLFKTEPLTNDEWELIRMHPTIAYELLKPIPFLQSALEIPYSHHEKWDGSGYPAGISGDEILTESRILAVADVVGAMTAERPYRAALDIEFVLKDIKKNAGKLFDKGVVKACLDLFRKKNFDF